jgi:hypothetical protein
MRLSLRPSLSTILVATFFFILLFLGLFAEVFESETQEVDLAQIYANPVPVDELQHLKQVRLANKNGKFVFENTHLEGNLEGPWQMIEPQALRVKTEVITKIIDALNVIRVRNFHRLEPINITSFSLDNPTLTLLFTNSQNKVFEIKMGLINPIDNSAYMTINTQNQIYQIDPMEIALESWDVAQLVESKVLALNVSALASLEMTLANNLTLKLIKKDDKWFDQTGMELNANKVEKFFERLEDLRSSSILEHLNIEQQEFMDKVMANPVYGLRLITGQGVRSYLIGEVKGGVPGMNMTNETRYALSSEDKKSFVLIDKDQLRMFSTTSKDLK